MSMDRFTKRLVACDTVIVLSQSDEGWSIGHNPRTGEYHIGGDVANTLAAYEDTGLTPEEIKDIIEMFHTYRHICHGIDPDRVSELTQAEKDGRLMVLPCKVGDRVFSGNGNSLDICVSKTNGDKVTQVLFNQKGYHFKCWWGWFHKSDIGKTVFLTREEAEAALNQKEETE